MSKLFCKILIFLRLKTVFFSNITQLINANDNNAPNIVNIKGIFFKKAFANSESIETRFDGNIKILFKKIGVPKPINKSLEKILIFF